MSSSKKYVAKQAQFNATVERVTLEQSKPNDVSIKRAIVKDNGEGCVFNGAALKELLQQFYTQKYENKNASIPLIDNLNFSDFKSLLRAFFREQKFGENLINYLIDENLIDRLGLGLDHLGNPLIKVYGEKRKLFPDSPRQVLNIDFDPARNSNEVILSLVSNYSNAMNISAADFDKPVEEKMKNPIQLTTEARFDVNVNDAANPKVSATYSASGTDKDKAQAQAVISSVKPPFYFKGMLDSGKGMLDSGKEMLDSGKGIFSKIQVTVSSLLREIKLFNRVLAKKESNPKPNNTTMHTQTIKSKARDSSSSTSNTGMGESKSESDLRDSAQAESGTRPRAKSEPTVSVANNRFSFAYSNDDIASHDGIATQIGRLSQNEIDITVFGR